VSAGPRIAFSTLAFPDASLATALSLGRGWGYSGVELRLIDGELIDPSMPAAARLGVSIGVETHDAFSASSVLAELLALVDSPWVGAVWDSHHPHRMGEQPAEVWANIGPRVLLAQVKDAIKGPERDADWRLVLLGEGEVRVQEMLGLLTGGGYRGWVSVEWEKRWHPEIEKPEAALPQHLRLLESWLCDPQEAV
jgi:fatty-acyl-CoA synthase